MNPQHWTRRAVIGGIGTGIITVLSGCSGSSSDSIFKNVSVDEMALVLEFESESPVEQVNVIRPDGELFAEREIPAGSSRETIDIGTDYQPGEYTILALEDGDEQARESIVIEPDVQITDLRLGRNHPDAMFDGAGDLDVRTEAIVTLRNDGSGLDEVTRLAFTGDVPRPTPQDYEDSGIYDPDTDIRNEADSITLLPDEEIILYSQSMPFSSVGDGINCSPNTATGEFEVIVETAIQDNDVIEQYGAKYTGDNLADCDIEVKS